MTSAVRIVAVSAEDGLPDQPGIALYHDHDGAFGRIYGPQSGSFLIRPDGYIGWHGRSWREEGLRMHLARVFLGLQ
jgi:hypothetical protein